MVLRRAPPEVVAEALVDVLHFTDLRSRCGSLLGGHGSNHPRRRTGGVSYPLGLWVPETVSCGLSRTYSRPWHSSRLLPLWSPSALGPPGIPLLDLRTKPEPDTTPREIDDWPGEVLVSLGVRRDARRVPEPKDLSDLRRSDQVVGIHFVRHAEDTTKLL